MVACRLMPRVVDFKVERVSAFVCARVMRVFEVEMIRTWNILIFVLLNLLKVAVVTVIFLMAVAYTVLLERKLVGRIQNRWGPSRVGPFGLLQPLADGLKLFLKEDLMPTAVFRPLFILAPIIALSCALISIGVIPFGENIRWHNVDMFQIADLNIGLLVILGVTSIGVYGIALSGWSSNNKYSLLGSLRSSAQMVSCLLNLRSASQADWNRTAHGIPSPSRYRQRAEHARHSLVERVWRIPVCRILHLFVRRIRGNQPHPIRPAGSGERTDRWISYRIQFDEVGYVLHGRVREHDHGRLRCHSFIPRWLVEPLRQTSSGHRRTGRAGAGACILVCS